MIVRLLLIAYTMLCAACASMQANTVPPKRITSSDWRVATTEVVQQYAPKADSDLSPYFTQAHIAYPPQKIALLTFKHEKRMELWATDYNTHNWRYIKTFPLTAISGGPGPKLKTQDLQIPEGVYQIVHLNPFSAWQLSMKLKYPNALDRQYATQDGRTALGNDIFIHGKNGSAGCLAIGDPAIDDLFVLVHRIGAQNVRVIIVPNDLRYKKPVTDFSKQPKWVPQLYTLLKQELQPFTMQQTMV